MKKRASRDWIPFWTDKWIFGSMRIEFNLEERSIWIDFLALGNKDDGWIRANEDTPYPIEQLSGMLIVPEEILTKAIEKFIKKGKLTKGKNGTLYITNWEKYCFTDRHKRRFAIPPNNPPLINNKEKKRIGEDRKGCPKKGHHVRKSGHPIDFDFEKQAFINIQKEDIERWKKTYPGCDIEQELLFMADWLISNPEKRKINYKSFISRWLKKTQDQGGTKGVKKKGPSDWALKKMKEEKSAKNK